MLRVSNFFFFLLVTSFWSCQSIAESDSSPYLTIIEGVQSHFVPDRRIARLDVETSVQEDGMLLLQGETTLPAAKDSLLSSLKAEGYLIKDAIEVLPSAELGDRTYALSRHSVANLRSAKGHSQELATQVLLGTPLRLLKQDEEWFFAQCPDGYLAWIHGGEIARLSEAALAGWKQADRVVFSAAEGYSYKFPDISSQQLGDLVTGDILVREGTLGDYTRIVYPDGRQGFVPSAQLQEFRAWLAERTLNFPLTQKIAFAQLGKPYFWGGTSPKAMDCSGFTKTVYWQQGLIIPRDASQQVHAGEALSYDDDLTGLKAGDFLFFGRYREDGSEKVTHVGIYLGDGAFIHSGSDNGANRVQQLLPGHPDYAAHRRESLLRARRLKPGTQGVQPVAEHPWYF